MREQKFMSNKQMSMSSIKIDIQSMLGLLCKPNTFNTQLIIKSSTFDYYFSKIVGNVYKLDGVYSCNTPNDLLYLICNMCRFMYDKQVFTGLQNIDLASSLLQRWIFGAKLLHIRHAARYDRLDCPKGTIDPLFDLLYHVLKKSYPNCHYVHAYRNLNEYQAQMKPIYRAIKSLTSPVNTLVTPVVDALNFVFMKGLNSLNSTFVASLISAFSSMSVEQKAQVSEILGQVDLGPILHGNSVLIADSIRTSVSSLPIISTMLITIETVYKMFAAFYDGLKKIIKDVLHNIGPLTRALLLVCGFIALFYACYKLGKGVATVAFNCLAKLFFKSEDVEVPEECITQMAPIEDFVCQFSFSSLSTGVVGLFSFLVFNKWDTKYVSALGSKLALAKNLSQVYSFVFENLVDIYRICYSGVVGRPFFEEDLVLQKFDELITEFYSITTEADILTYVRDNPDAIKRVIRLYKDMADYDKRVRSLKSLTSMQQSRWSNMLNVARMWSNICQRKAREQVTRVEPVWINIEGPPGVGKSVCVDQLINAIFIKYNERLNQDVRAAVATDRFERKIDNEFWDGYESQFAVTIDDLYQVKMVEQRMRISEELIHMCNNTSFPLHMSMVEEKSNTFFNSLLIITTTNDSSWTNLGITDADAIHRRVTISIEKIRTADFPANVMESPVYLYDKHGPTRKKLVHADGDTFVLLDIVDLAVNKMLEKRTAAETFLKVSTPGDVLKMKSGKVITLPSFYSKAEPAVKVEEKVEIKAEVNLRQRKPKKSLQPSYPVGYKHIPKAQKATNIPFGATWLDNFNKRLRDQFTRCETTSWNDPFVNLEELRERFIVEKFVKPWGQPVVLALMEEGFREDQEFTLQDRHPVLLEWDDVDWTYNLSFAKIGKEVVMVVIIQDQRILDFFNEPDIYATLDTGVLANVPPVITGNLWYNNLLDLAENRKLYYMDTDTLTVDLLITYSSMSLNAPPYWALTRPVQQDGTLMYYLKSYKVELAILTTISLTLLGAMALWNYLKAHDYESQSIDKSHAAKNMKIARGKHYSNVNQVAERVLMSKKQHAEIKSKVKGKIVGTRIKNNQKIRLGGNKEVYTKLSSLELNDNRVSVDKVAASRTAKKVQKIKTKLKDREVSNKRTRARKWAAEGHFSADEAEDETDEDTDSESDCENDFYYEVSDVSGDVEMQMSSTSAFIANKFALNTKAAFINYENEASIGCYLFFVKGTIACTSSHYLRAFKDQPDSISLYMPRGQEGSLTIPFKRIELKYMPGRDLVYLNFPHEVPSYRNVVKFLKPFCPGDVQRNPARIEWSHLSVEKSVFSVRSFVAGAPSKAFGSDNPLKSILNGPTGKIAFDNQEYYRVPKLPGYAGACGLPYMDYSDNAKPLMGIHVAGLDDISIVCPIKLEDFTDFETQASIGDEVHSHVKHYLESSLSEGLIHVCPEIPGVDNICQLERKHYIPSETQIKPSLLQDKGLHEPTLFPAKLKGDPSPLGIAMSKYQGKPFEYNDVLKDVDDDRIFAGVISEELAMHYRKKLTLKEAIDGNPSLHIPSMDLTTGLGEPFTQVNVTTDMIFDRKKPPSGKALQYGLSFHVHDAFIEEFERVQEEYEQEDLLATYPVNDTLKDETRDKPRVEAHKTRLFDAGPKTHMLYKKMLLGHLVADIERGRQDCDILVGINVHSFEWTLVYKQLRKFIKDDNEPAFICGDFGRWDKSLRLFFAFRIALYLAKLMQFDLKDTLLLQRLIRSAMLAVHYNPLGVYRVREGGTSGDYLTSIFNSIYNSVIHRLAFNFLCPHLKWKFDSYVRLFVYGDDSIGSIHKDVRGLFNMKTLAKFFDTYLGMEYTSATKGSIEFPLLPLTDVSFLKRKFGFVKVEGSVEPTTYVVAQLDKESIHNSILWTREFKTREEEWQALISTCDSYLMEYFKYGKSEFEYNRRKLMHVMNGIADLHQYKRYFYEDYENILRVYASEATDQ